MAVWAQSGAVRLAAGATTRAATAVLPTARAIGDGGPGSLPRLLLTHRRCGPCEARALLHRHPRRAIVASHPPRLPPALFH
jgi:hypothetical protein